MLSNMEKIDVMIIGGGILGLVLANKLSKCDSINSAVIVSSDDFHTASLHNQSWLQSGGLYDLDDKEQLKVAELCIMHGRKLVEMLNIQMLRGCGIMALKDQKEAEKKIKFFERFGFKSDSFNSTQIAKVLGYDFSSSPQFTPDTCFIRTPDQPFPEGDLLRFCEDSLRIAKFNFSTLKGRAILEKHSLAPNGYIVKVNNQTYCPSYLFIMAGLNTKHLLQPLGLDNTVTLSARRCVLMKSSFITDLKVPIFIDKLSNTNINTVKDLRGNIAYLLGDSQSKPVSMLDRAIEQQVNQADKEQFIENFCSKTFYPHLRTRLEPLINDNSNFSVCFKVENQSYLPWIYESNILAPEFPNIFIAGPGKATLAYYTAHELIKKANINLEGDSVSPNGPGTSSKIVMWFEK